ncbi:RTT109 [Candida jiufengensis]|uniref:RTT109 n=1 Tax=Candida jiufengensis TaxID=497108 RepID=UPI002224C81C|nr:RTT109 [Candida jiufengensis]KAI5950852.1 RTT109 [Candida jiufengensis]
MSNILSSKLSNLLPRNESYKYLYLQTKPIYIKSPIHQHLSKKSDSDTVKVRHFFTLIQNDIIILGIEIFVYLQIYEDHIDQFIFVSKCDTVGLIKLNFKVGDVIKEVMDFIINYNVSDYHIKLKKVNKKSKENDETFSQSFNDTNENIISLNKLIDKLQQNIHWYKQLPYYNTKKSEQSSTSSNLRKLPTTINLKLCIFTKTAPQYIFPNSSKNQLKHKINGQNLLKWWLKIVESITLNWPTKNLIIPGSDTISSLKFIENLPTDSNWEIGHIFNKPKERLAIFTIPLFPDDPKGRFLEHLIVENRYSSVSIDQFYEELGYRQEFRIGDCVGLIGCEINNYQYEKFEKTKNDFPIITISEYKQFINILKSIHYNVMDDIKNLISDQIPNFFIQKLGDENFKFGEVIGKKEISDANKTNGNNQKRVQANDLNGFIKRKKK